MTTGTIEGFRLSPRQKYLWRLQDPQEALHFVCQCPVAIHGELNIDRLRQALATVVERHEILRTSFRAVKGMALPLQVIADDAEVPLQIQDLSERADADQDQALADLTRQAAETIKGFDQDQQAAFMLVKLGPARHVLLLTLSALCADGPSLVQLTQSIAMAYEGKEWEEEDIPFVNISEWQHEMLVAEDAELGRKYWQDRNLTTFPQPSLPGSTNATGFKPAVVHHAVPTDLWKRLTALASSREEQVGTWVLTAWAALLSRLTLESQLLINTSLEGRLDEELAEAVGPLDAYVPVTLSTAPSKSFATWVAAIQATRDEATEWQDYFDWGSIFDTEERTAHPHFAFETRDIPRQIFGEATTFQPGRVELCTDRFEFKCILYPSTGELAIAYNAHGVSATVAQGAALQLTALLEDAANRPDADVLDLNLLNPDTHRRMITDWNQTDVNYQRTPYLHRLIQEQAAKTPNATALITEDGGYTYQAVQDRANQIAHYLIGKGVGTDAAVALCMERGFDMLTSMLGIMGAGGVYVPLEPGLPEDRTDFMLKDTGAKIVITSQALSAPFENADLHILCTDRDAATLQAQDTTTPIADTTPRQAAYIIYTSGSTGVPKGVVLSHEAAVNHMLWLIDTFGFNQDTRILHKAAMSFDASIWELVVPLMAGGVLVMARPDGHRDPEYLVSLIEEHQVTVLQNVPTMLQTLYTREEFARISCLEYLFCAGEALSYELVRRVQEDGPSGKLINMYGPTEAAIDVTFWPTSTELPGDRVPIGKPLPNTQIYILNERLRPVPPLTPGQLFIGGLNLARGYANRPARTAQAFIPDPFSAQTGDRLYATGDMARFLPDGNIEFLGRGDDQVKFHGYRIELGEIETVLEDHPDVRHAAVLVREDIPGDQQLVAYAAATPGAHTESEHLRAFLTERLPAFMVPNTFVLLENMPLTNSGKIDRNALPEPDLTQAQQAFVAPRTPVEQSIAAIWEEILHLDRIGLNDNYFAIGGDSIRSINIIGKAADLGMHFTVQDLFSAQTVGALAALVEKGETGKTDVAKTEAFELISAEDRAKIPAGVEDAYPLTVLQSGMMFHSEINREVAAYYNVNSRLMEGPFKEPLFREAVETSVVKHPALRTSIHYTGYSEPLQLVHEQVEIPLKVHDISHLGKEEQDKAIMEAFFEQKYARFEFEKPPLFKLEVFLLSDNAFRVVHTDHHAILDGWSVAALNTELFNAYVALLENRPIDKAPPATVFRDYVAMEKRVLASEDQRRYWMQSLAGAEPLRFPREMTAPTEPELLDKMEIKIANVHYPVPDQLAADMKATARTIGVPLKSLCMAAHLRVLNMLTNRTDLMSGFSSNGRLETEDGDRVLGLFLNALPFRLQLDDGNMSWRDLMIRCFQKEQEIIHYRRFPMGEMHRVLDIGELFEISFNYIDFHVYNEIEEQTDFQFKGNLSSHGTNFTMLASFSLNPFTNETKIDLSYNPNVISDELGVQITKYYVEAVQAIIQEPNQPIFAFSPLPQAEHQHLLTALNDTPAIQPTYPHLAAASTAWAETKADAPALAFQERLIAWRDLEAQANRIAHVLGERGVGRETPVAVFFERSPEMIISLLAIIKAGGAYIPLDPEFPKERLAFLLQDSHAKAVLTQEALMHLLPESDAQVFALEREAVHINAASEAPPAVAIDSDQLAYIIYTSGSTGRPKGVGISHRALTNYAYGVLDRLALSDEASMSMLATVAADLGNTAIFGALYSGRCLRMLPQAMNLDPAALVKELEARPVDSLKIVPSHLKALLAAPRAEMLLPRKLLILGGEKLDQSLAEQVQSLNPDCRIINHYGPTEATIGALTQEVVATSAADGAQPIGRPIAGMQAFVLDKALQPVPAGVAGDLYLAGEGLARGYVGRPAHTAELFVPNPVATAAAAGARLYRTGDVVRALQGGELLFVGRADHQIKIRGYRVDLPEIEAVLIQLEQVREAVVLAHQTEAGQTGLAAYLVTDGEPSRSEIQRDLARLLPDYMIPATIIFLDQMPLNANGKLDRRALPQPDQEQPVAKEYVAPSTDTEQALADIWQEVLETENIGVHDVFFERGGNSLLAMLVVTRVRDMFQLEVSVQTLFEATTIQDLAAKVDALVQENQLLQQVTATDDAGDDEETEEMIL